MFSAIAVIAGKHFYQNLLFLSGLAGLFLTPFLSSATCQQLITNSGFELESEPGFREWSLGKRLVEGTVTADREQKVSGQQSALLQVTGKAAENDYRQNISLSSSWQAVEPGWKISWSVWLRSQDIVSRGGYAKGRITVTYYDSSRNRLKGQDTVRLENNNDWKQYSGQTLVPDKAAYINFRAALTDCTGKLWVDDFTAEVVGKAMQAGLLLSQIAENRDVLFPQPWEAHFGDSLLQAAKICLPDDFQEMNFQRQLQKIILRNGGEIVSPGTAGALPLLVGDRQLSALTAAFKNAFPEVTWDDLGQEGYFLELKREGIYLGGNTEQARFLGLQTLGQLARGAETYASARIVDRPGLSRRGVVVGLQWYQKFPELLERMWALKLNFIWHHGSYMDNLFSQNWRQPFTEAQRMQIERNKKLCDQYFIDIYMAFTPRGTPPVCYSSEEEILTLADKMRQLYNIGIRNLGISFDDLQNIGQDKLTYPEDIQKFGNNFGQAHCFFVSKVYENLIKDCPELNFTILPFMYGSLSNASSTGLDYIHALSAIPTGIQTWCACLYSAEDVAFNLKYTGRKTLIWDNMYTTGKLAAFPLPPERSTTFNDKEIYGYMFLPAIPKQEDASGISWLNMANYIWAPERYKASESYHKSIAFFAQKPELIRLLREYGSFALKIDAYDFPSENRAVRLAAIDEALQKLSGYAVEVGKLPEKLQGALQQDISRYQENLQLIRESLRLRPYPLLVPRHAEAVFTDDTALQNFFSLKRGQSVQDTRAWLSYDSENIYLRVHCQEPEMNKLVVKQRERDRNIFQDDCIEFFLLPEVEDPVSDFIYYHFAINSQAVIYDCKHIRRRYNYLHEQDKSWDADLQIKTSTNRDSWALEITIPFQSMQLPAPEVGSRIFMNLARARYAGGEAELSSYPLLLRGKFHDLNSFLPLEFR